MRFQMVLVSLLLVATAAAGRPSGLPKPNLPPRVLDLGSINFHLFHRQDSAAVEVPEAGADQWSQQSGTANLSMGPLHARFGRDDNPRAGLSVYKSQGMDQLGGSMWEDEAGRSAKLLFIWPTDK